MIDLSDTRTGRLDDGHGEAWPRGDVAMRITTLAYGDIEGLAALAGSGFRDGIAARLAWIERHERSAFSPQPYRILIAALRAAGHPDEVARVEMAARVQRRRIGAGSVLVKTGNAVLEWTSGYGYSPFRAFAALVLLFLAGWGGITLAEWQGAFEPSLFMDSTLLAAAMKGVPTGSCPWLDPPLYALDLIMPVVALGHENLCSIRADQTFWLWAATAYRLFGWILVSIALLTFAGILKKDV